MQSGGGRVSVCESSLFVYARRSMLHDWQCEWRGRRTGAVRIVQAGNSRRRLGSESETPMGDERARRTRTVVRLCLSFDPLCLSVFSSSFSSLPAPSLLTPSHPAPALRPPALLLRPYYPRFLTLFSPPFPPSPSPRPSHRSPPGLSSSTAPLCPSILDLNHEFASAQAVDV